ncbi:MAG: CrcB family protein [Halorhabdus sp.]
MTGVGALTAAILVGVGGAGGALARHLLGERIDARTADTLAVNVVGSFALGVVTAAPLDGTVVLAVGTGFCGAFTTFSTFAFETVRLFETGERRRAAGNAAVTLAAALLGVGLGGLLASALW